jgi:hypothetical protein
MRIKVQHTDVSKLAVFENQEVVFRAEIHERIYDGVIEILQDIHMCLCCFMGSETE